jgi:hypothetical protein
MPRRSHRPLLIVETFAPDPDRCAAALLRLLDWKPPATADAPETPQDAACGKAPQVEQAEPDDAP